MGGERRKHKKLCVHCKDKKAGYLDRSRNWKTDTQHVLCQRCYCSLCDSVMATLLVR